MGGLGLIVWIGPLGIGAFMGWQRISEVGLIQWRGYWMGGVDLLGWGSIAWIGRLGIGAFTGGAWDQCSWSILGRGYCMRGIDSLGGGLIAWIGRMGIGAFTGGGAWDWRSGLGVLGCVVLVAA